LLQGGPILRISGYADAGANAQLQSGNVIGFRNFGDDPLAQVAAVGAGPFSFYEDRKFVPAIPDDFGAFRHQLFEAQAHFNEQFVSQGMAKGIVDIFEIVQINKQEKKRGRVIGNPLIGNILIPVVMTPTTFPAASLNAFLKGRTQLLLILQKYILPMTIASLFRVRLKFSFVLSFFLRPFMFDRSALELMAM
jgi:hypothetical protein